MGKWVQGKWAVALQQPHNQLSKTIQTLLHTDGGRPGSMVQLLYNRAAGPLRNGRGELAIKAGLNKWATIVEGDMR